MDVELRYITKTFGSLCANDNISLVVPSGTIQGILGENGAGKSTLMKILSGFIQADTGEIFLDGQRVTIQSPADAIHNSVGMLHQDPLDFPPMRVIDNFLMGHQGQLFPDRKTTLNAFKDLQQQFGFSLDAEAYVDMFTVGERQQLEILRLLWLGARVLIMDEPTTGISALQKEKLFTTLRRLASEGKTILFVSHKLEEVEELCHRVVVLRRGKQVGEARPPYSRDKLVEMMFGKIVSMEARKPASPGDIVLELHKIMVEDYRLRIGEVNAQIKAGEVIGLAGMEGSGQEMLLRACAGFLRPVAGKVLVEGHDLTGKSYHAFMHRGVAFLPASRLEEGLVPGLTLAEHVTLTGQSRGMFINRNLMHLQTEERIAEFNIHGMVTSTVESLSGGNQQRTLLALLKKSLTLLLLEHPTRGLDIESTIYIWHKLKERCQSGTTIVFISSDLEEILQYSDRILVFFCGKVSPFLDASLATVDQLGQLIGGGSWSEMFSAQE